MPLLSQPPSHPTSSPTLRTLIRGFLIALLLVGANIAAMFVWRMYDPAPRLVTVDLDGTVQTFIAETAESDLSDDGKRARTETFARELDRALQGLAARRRMVILPAPTVIAGAQDITEAVRRGLKP